MHHEDSKAYDGVDIDANSIFDSDGMDMMGAPKMLTIACLARETDMKNQIAAHRPYQASLTRTTKLQLCNHRLQWLASILKLAIFGLN